jgi:hypothetical protein
VINSVVEPQHVPQGLTVSSRRMLTERFGLWFPLAVFLLTRTVNAVMIGVASRKQIAIPSTGLEGRLAIPSPASPDYWVVAANWDGRWYGAIAAYGYPDHLPIDAAGHVLPNAYAFPPLYPMLVRVVMMATGLDFTMAGPIVSLACGAGAMVLVYRLVADTAGRRAGALTVMLLCTFMSAPVFQISYSEGLALLLVSGALWLLTRRQYGALATVLVLLSLTRPVAPAITLVILVHGWTRHRNRSEDKAFVLRDRLWVIGVAVLGALLAGAWPLCVAVMTGKPSAYLDTMAAWVQDGGPRALTAWPSVLWQQVGVLGLLLSVVVACFWLVRRPGARAWSIEVRTWAWAYPLFMFATGLGSSSIRYAVMAFPLIWPFVESPTTRAERRAQLGFAMVLAAFGIVAQWVWISHYLVTTAYADGTIP